MVRLLGDPYQLAAVEAGGALRLIAGAGGAIELDGLHRVTRLNRRRMTLRGGRDLVKNDDTWAIQTLISSDDVVVRHTSMLLTAMYFALQS
ncbi:AAA family ATPase [Streptomyces sp. NBC_01727]|uniref:AAA family ATPase n=1 Tax=Streptomyces sp. NBC_01727 TaxID=2975924 RepID=UPI002E0FF640